MISILLYILIWTGGIQAGGKKVEPGFEYSSGKNSQWLSVDDLKKLLKDVEEH
mgnify:CR=1 FL=1